MYNNKCIIWWLSLHHISIQPETTQLFSSRSTLDGHLKWSRGAESLSGFFCLGFFLEGVDVGDGLHYFELTASHLHLSADLSHVGCAIFHQPHLVFLPLLNAKIVRWFHYLLSLLLILLLYQASQQTHITFWFATKCMPAQPNRLWIIFACLLAEHLNFNTANWWLNGSSGMPFIPSLLGKDTRGWASLRGCALYSLLPDLLLKGVSWSSLLPDVGVRTCCPLCLQQILTTWTVFVLPIVWSYCVSQNFTPHAWEFFDFCLSLLEHVFMIECILLGQELQLMFI